MRIRHLLAAVALASALAGCADCTEGVVKDYHFTGGRWNPVTIVEFMDGRTRAFDGVPPVIERGRRMKFCGHQKSEVLD